MDKFDLVLIRQDDSGAYHEDEVIELTSANYNYFSQRAFAKSILNPNDTYWLVIRDTGVQPGYGQPYIDYNPEFESRSKWDVS